MTTDIGQELYEKIKAEFEGRVSANGYIKAVTKRIAEGTATMNDVSLYAKALGSEVRLAIAYNISTEVLPEGQMFYNIAQKILDPLLHDNHSMVNDIAAQVQKKLDERKGIRIKPQKAEFPEDRLGSVLSAASEQGLDEATMKRRMSAPAETMTQSFADDYMKENAKFRTRAGFKEYIVRKEDGKCCEWCSKLAGRYLYPESTPHDVFRRHDNCGCSVTYEDGEMRTRQQVWSKRDWSDEEEQKYLEASDDYKRRKRVYKKDREDNKQGKLSSSDLSISSKEKQKALAKKRELLAQKRPLRLSPEEAKRREASVKARIEGRRVLTNKPDDDILLLEATSPFNNPKTPLSINTDLQSKHIKGGKRYIDYLRSHNYEPSMLTISEEKAQELVNKYHGTGILKLNKSGKVLPSEIIVDNDTVVGYAVNNRNGKIVEATGFKIHYSEKGTHIVPIYENQKEYWKRRREENGHNWLFRQKS